ncbi:hypothetical protein [Tenacibaculum finnmarkense]|uniref:hypothetical protein n=1 Tax=Tenacibaculum finnmarkense TaxID=2781243 RepID=UPI001EFBEC2F|nr:hypothetical protein [Tenacibaculum finnmarkense]MCG8801995.1 hypothetical protein [Tenacibaculum finnmarkense]MCG8824724.1 hypothetical protein [Tenacibaculum finnmarkense]
MLKNISIHKATFHDAFQMDIEENQDVLEDILSTEKFIYPLKDKDHYYLYDVSDKKILDKNLNPENFKIDTTAEVVSFTGVPMELIANIKLPEKVTALVFQGGDLMPLQMGKTQKGDALWKTIMNYIKLYPFNEGFSERILMENEIRNLYAKLPSHIADFGLTTLFQKIEASNITEFTIGWAYFSEFDFKMLSKLNQLESLSILYCYNDAIKYLPKNLKDLQIFGTTIQKLSEINLNLPNLIDLNVSGNALNTLDTLHILPSTLEGLDVSNNLIKYFDISELPENLEYLELSNNLINNDLFNQKLKNEELTHKKLKHLLLSNNELIITASILHLILEIFPNLESLELLDNQKKGIPSELLGDFENRNCLENVQHFLEDIQFLVNHDYEMFLSASKLKEINNSNNSSDLNEFIEIKWQENKFPLRIILENIQYEFSKYFLKMPSFTKYVNGIYCFIAHDNCEFSLYFEEETKEITFKIQADTSAIVDLYFHKYFKEINMIISSNSHINILPSVRCAKSCDFLKDFCNKVYKIDYKIKSDVILKKETENIKILINNRSIESVNDDGKFAGNKYQEIQNIAFILISGKSAYPFIIKNGVVTNALKLAQNSEYYYSLTLKMAFDKEVYTKSITNKYLNGNALVESSIFIDNAIKKKLSCFVNPNYFKVKDNVLTINDLQFPKLAENHLKKLKMEGNKYCHFTVDNDVIELKYSH